MAKPINDIFGTLEDDLIVASRSNNIIHALAGNDTVFAGRGKDTLYGGAGNDTLYGEDGNDSLFGEEGDDTLYGGNGNDKLYGQDGNDTLYGGAGNDTIYAGTGNNEIFGDSGNDTFIYQGGNDYYDGENGIDTLDLSNFGSAIWLNTEWLTTDLWTRDGIDLSNSNSWRELGEIENVENFILTDYSDSMWGDGNDNVIQALGGDDIIFGGGGNDTIVGGDGRDVMGGDSGADTFVFEAATAFNDIDIIRDFTISDGDALDISDILTAYDPLTDLITDFVEITDNGHKSFVKVDVDGGADNFVQIAVLKGGVTGHTDEAALVENGALIV